MITMHPYNKCKIYAEDHNEFKEWIKDRLVGPFARSDHGRGDEFAVFGISDNTLMLARLKYKVILDT